MGMYCVYIYIYIYIHYMQKCNCLMILLDACHILQGQTAVLVYSVLVETDHIEAHTLILVSEPRP